jgi:single-strand DNA-binding protein
MSVNKVILVGNVGKDPEVRYLEKNVAVANFPLATTERGYKMNNGTEVPDRTEWHNIVAWRQTAEFIEKYVKKGSQVFIEGKLKTRSYEDKTGNKRYITEIYADQLQLLGRRPDNNGENHQAAPQPAVAPAQEPAVQANPFDDAPVANDAANDSDLPF